jgi:hypothetical protein
VVEEVEEVEMGDIQVVLLNNCKKNMIFLSYKSKDNLDICN